MTYDKRGNSKATALQSKKRSGLISREESVIIKPLRDIAKRKPTLQFVNLESTSGRGVYDSFDSLKVNGKVQTAPNQSRVVMKLQSEPRFQMFQRGSQTNVHFLNQLLTDYQVKVQAIDPS
jgi:hypothetical protein